MVTEMATGKLLTPKQERFCINLFKGMSQREAWINAGYSNKYSAKIIDENACRLAAKSKIETRMAELRQAAQDEAVADFNERQRRLTEFIRANLKDFVDTDGNITLEAPYPGALSELVIEDWQGGKDQRAISRTKKVKLRDPISAIAELNKMDKVYDSGGSNYNDNRTINIIVSSDKAKELTEGVSKRFIEGD